MSGRLPFRRQAEGVGGMGRLGMAISTNLVAITLVAAATAIALSGREGWGWFLFAAVLVIR